jgi:hypothetical protein
MSWSQTPSSLTIVVSLRTSNEIQSSIEFTESTLDFRVVINDESTPYKMTAKWFADVVRDECKWKRLGNGDLLLTIAKASEKEWTHPFADRAYKGFVHIDWSRWVDLDCSDNDEDDHFDLGGLSSASAGDFGGEDQMDFPSESNPEFQEMMSGLEKLGRDTNIKLPDFETLKGINSDDMKDLLKNTTNTTDAGCSELDLDKVNASLDIKETSSDNNEEGEEGDDSLPKK